MNEYDRWTSLEANLALVSTQLHWKREQPCWGEASLSVVQPTGMHGSTDSVDPGDRPRYVCKGVYLLVSLSYAPVLPVSPGFRSQPYAPLQHKII